MSDAATINVLLVEDNDGDARLIEIELSEANVGHPADARFEVERCARLADGLARACAGDPDVALLDLNLPDSRGADSFARLHEARPDLPVVVLSGLEDEQLGAHCVRQGAQDYLVKGNVDGAVLARALRYAIERRRAERERDERERAERLLEQREREIESYRRLAAPAPAAVTGGTFGVRALRQEAPERFDALIERYASLLDQALEERTYRVAHRLSDALRGLATELGFMRAGPRDVVELHTAALGRRIGSVNAKKAHAYVDEARILVLELMGHLVAYYRR